MMKKIIALSVTLIAVAFQVIFIIGFGYSGGKRQVEMLYEGFGIEQIPYSVWVLNLAQSKIIWLLPIVSLFIGIWAAGQSGHIKTCFGVLLPLIVVVALYVAVYFPIL